MKLPFAQIEPTTRCNFTCGFCAGRHMAQQDISLETFGRFIDQVEGLEHIELQGEGEPLLHPQFFELVERARAKFPGLQVSMISNGSLFTTENIDRLLKHRIARIFVSTESGDDATFQRIRGGKLERVRRGIANLLAERDARGMDAPVVGLAVTVLKTTVRESLRGITGLYRDLKLDGGINIQRLQSMPQYRPAQRHHPPPRLLPRPAAGRPAVPGRGGAPAAPRDPGGRGVPGGDAGGDDHHGARGRRGVAQPHAHLGADPRARRAGVAGAGPPRGRDACRGRRRGERRVWCGSGAGAGLLARGHRGRRDGRHQACPGVAVPAGDRGADALLHHLLHVPLLPAGRRGGALLQG